MATALLGLGSNLGDRAAALEKAIGLLKAEPQIRVAAVSSFRPSKPAGGPERQGEFINAAARLETSLGPEELLAKILAIEDQVGRVRVEHWGPRVIDLDLLLYDRVEMKTPTLELPHPRMCYRRFVLEPAAEIASEMVWPVNGWSVEKLLDNIDRSEKYIAISASSNNSQSIREWLLPIQAASNCRLIFPPEDRVRFPFERSTFSIPEIEFVHWPRDSRWAISDFWYDRDALEIQWNWLPAVSTPDLNLSRWETAARNALARWEELRPQVIQPRLVFLLPDAVDRWKPAETSDPIRQRELQSLVVDQREKYHSILRLFLRRPNCPPAICLPVEDLDGFKHEVLAAMQAME